MTRDARTAHSAPRKTQLSSAVGAESGGGERPLKIGEAARLLGVEAYVLRFWETQFPFLRPRHARSKHRFYAVRDLDTLRLIKRLLHQERFTIEGAKKYIREVGLEKALSAKPGVPVAPIDESREHGGTQADAAVRRTLAEVRRELESLHRMLED
jgi:DNA-binding transcriptional MerR regulator